MKNNKTNFFFHRNFCMFLRCIFTKGNLLLLIVISFPTHQHTTFYFLTLIYFIIFFSIFTYFYLFIFTAKLEIILKCITHTKPTAEKKIKTEQRVPFAI